MNAFDRNINLTIIQELRNSDKIVLDDYIDKVLIPLKEQNSNFCQVLYKDIHYLLDGLDAEGDNDLVFENGDFVIENGDFKLSGYQTRLHNIVVWLDTEAIQDIEETSKNVIETFKRIEEFNSKFLSDFTFTPEYKLELDKIKSSLKKERRDNYDKQDDELIKSLNSDFGGLKPNILGVISKS